MAKLLKKPLLIVDGYNMVAFWEVTRTYFQRNQLDAARDILLEKLSNYAGFAHLDIICVFDAQHMPGLRQEYDYHRVKVIFTEEDETADTYIERLAVEYNNSRYLVSVATSDLYEQWAIFSQGALRVSARELEKRVNTVKLDMQKVSKQLDLKTPYLSPMNEQDRAKLQNLLNQFD